MKPLNVILLGSGNVAWHFVSHLSGGPGIHLQQWYFRNSEKIHQANLPEKPEVVHELNKIRADADVYLLAVKDDSIAHVSAKLKQLHGNQEVVVAHMSGALPPETLHPGLVHRAVWYPLQTFTAGRPVDLKEVPVFLCSDSITAAEKLSLLSENLGLALHIVNSKQKMHLHLAAVMLNNFTNHWLTMGFDYLEKHGMAREYLYPLIRETFVKALETGPCNAQSGPAKRMDLGILAKHLEMLSFDPELGELYRLMSQSISRYYRVSNIEEE